MNKQEITIKEHIIELLNYIANSENSAWKLGSEAPTPNSVDNIASLHSYYKSKEIIVCSHSIGGIFFLYNNIVIDRQDINRFIDDSHLFAKVIDKIRDIKIDIMHEVTAKKMIDFFGLEQNND